MSRLLREQSLVRPSIRAARMNRPRLVGDRTRHFLADPEGDLDWIAMTCLAGARGAVRVGRGSFVGYPPGPERRTDRGTPAEPGVPD
ncbi:MAG: hypothetical protein R3B46_09500 [Phycisphaerales bacterium]